MDDQELEAMRQENAEQERVSKEQRREKSKNRVESAVKTARNLAKNKSLVAALGPILIWIFVIILIIIVVIGIAMFVMTMPGMVMEKLKALSDGVGDCIAALFGGDSTEYTISEQQIYDVLDYLEEMNYDLKGFGFLTDYVEEGQSDNKDGVKRNSDGKIDEAKSDFIFTYLASDNYIYTIANYNLVTQNSEYTGFLGILRGLAGSIGAVALDIANALTNGQAGTNFGQGLIDIYFEDGNTIGKLGSHYGGFTDWIGWNDIKIKDKVLKIKRGWGSNYMEFELDGWTGRYGMPLEFLTSVHLATYMPDLSYDMATGFNTRVIMLLHDVTGSVTATYECSNGESIDSTTVYEAIVSGNYKSIIDKGIGNVPNCQCVDTSIQQRRVRMIDNPNTIYWERIDSNGYKTYWDDTTGDFIEVLAIQPEMVEAIQGEEYTSLESAQGCFACQSRVNDIYNALVAADQSSFNTFDPYIAYVTDHWYRDVYFVANENYQNTAKNIKKNPMFVSYDYEYEAIMRERWTLYETDSQDEYVLYKINDDGTYKTDNNGNLIKYNGTEEEAREKGVSVAKKAVTFGTDSDMLEKLNWNYNSGIWSSYVSDENSNESTQPAYPDPEDSSDPVKSRISVKISTSNNIKQTGEGLRTETNAKIKKMFLNNKYFRYDGERENAEIITALRNNLNIPYGALSEEDLEKTTEYNGETYKVSEFAGQVTLQQDALNNFSMLENTHTLDADYIYRDFKELVVELGYYEKEELTDETPRLLQWLVPDTGSSGFPYRPLDKKENDSGTFIHSKGDIDANIKNTLVAAIIAAFEGENQSASNNSNSGSTPEISAAEPNMDFNTVVSGIDMVANSNGEFVSLGSISQPSGSLLSLEEWWEEIDKMMQTFTSEHWEYKMNHDYSSFDKAVAANAKWTDCSLFASWALQKLGVLNENQTFSSHMADNLDVFGEYQDVGQAILDAGAEIIVVNGQIGSEDKLQPGDVVFFDDNVGHVTIYYGEGPKCYDAGGDYWNSQQEPIPYNSVLTRNCTIIVRFPFGNSKGEGAPYEGYLGNEAVVSPVTGILLEYGTYTENDKGERINLDIKYDLSTLNKTDPENDNDDTYIIPRQEYEDKVGYAKILILDKEHYQKLESATNNKWKNNSLLEEDGDFRQALNNAEELEDWSTLNKTVYGYKEFLELYEEYEIAGNLLVIDGFKCELVDEEFASEEDIEKALEEKIPSGTPITIDNYKIASNELDNEDKVMPSLYEPDEIYEIPHKEMAARHEAEVTVKEQAATSIKINAYNEELKANEELIFIKEGTVLGRTITDKELIEVIRDGDLGSYDKLRGKEKVDGADGEPENQNAVIGNYIQILMKNGKESSFIENVEDYLKLDEGEEKKNTEIDWEFWYFSPYEGAGWDEEECGPEAVKDEAMYANNFDVGIIQWTTHPTLSPGGVQNFCKRAAELDPSMCGVLAKYGGMSDSEIVVQSNRTQMQKEFTEICNKDRDGFTQIQIQIAMEDYFDVFCQQNNCEWLKEAPSVVQGTVMSAAVCNGPYTQIALTQGDDEGNIKAAINNIRSSKPALEGRLQAQEVAALDILNKRVTIDEVEIWVRKKQTPANYNWNERIL